MRIRGHEVDAVGQVLPGTRHTRHLRLAAELAFGAHLPRHAGDFGGKRVELIDHRVDGVLQLEDFAAHVDGDFAGKIAAGDRGGDLRDVAHLRGEVAAHRIDRVGEVLPGPGDARHDRLTAELTVGAHLARHARDFRSKRAQLVHHGVDGFLELQNLAAHVDGDLFREVTVGDRDGDLGDVAHLRGEVRGHRVDVLGEVLPHTGHFAHLRLTAKLAFGAHLTRNARHFRGEHAQLLDHRVDDVGGTQELAFERPAVDIEPHGLQKVALRHCRNRARDFRRRPQEIVNQRVNRGLHLAPGAARQGELHALAGFAVATHHLAHAVELLRHALVRSDDLVEGIGDFAEQTNLAARHTDGEIAHPHGLQRT